MQDVDILEDVVGRLEWAGLPYMLTGSMAMNCYAATRTTFDIDLVLELAPVDAQRIVDLFADDYYLDDLAIEEAITRRSAFNLIHYTTPIKVDCIVPEDTEYRRAQFERRHRLPVGNTTLWVIAPEDLALSKLNWARQSRSERQFADVRNVLSSGQPLDRDYLARWAASLGLNDLLREVTA